MKQSSGGNGYHYAVRRKNDEAPLAGLFHFHKYARYLSSTFKKKKKHEIKKLNKIKAHTLSQQYDALLSAEKQAGVRYAQPKKKKKQPLP